MKQTLLALGLALGVGASASAQTLPRRPASSFAMLKKQPNVTPLVVPVAASIPVDATPAYNAESAKIFATKVHPILMNACAGCHGRNDHAGEYKLKRLDEGYENAPGIERNLRATVKHLDRVDPGASSFLIKAITAHGKSKEAPLFSKAHPAYKYLEVWAYRATQRDGSAMPAAIPEPIAKRPEIVPPMKQVEPAKVPENFATEVKSDEPGRLNPDDPFDPGAFNRAAHPRRK